MTSAARRIALCLGALLAVLLGVPEAAHAQFGRNKVQYRSFDYRVIETRHFDIYYYPEEKELAVDVARMAERTYGRLSRILDHEFQERKPILLFASHSDFQQTNALQGLVSEATGGVTEPLKDRVMVPATGSYAELDHVLAHELVHAFQFDILRRGPVEEAATPSRFVPSLWFMEGMAEYLSIGHIDAKTAAWVRDAAMDGYLRTIAEMTRFDDFLSYRFGQSLWSYIGKRWGDETIGILLKRAGGMGIERAFRRTLGITLDELSVDWQEAVREAYLPQVARLQPADAVAHRVTDYAFPDHEVKSAQYIAPALSPDGTEMVYLSDRGYDLYSFYDLYLADARTGKVKRRLVRSARSADFESLRFLTSSAEFSPDGKRIAFVAQAGERDALYVIDARDGSVERKWQPDLNGLQGPTWSPDGTRIAITGLKGGMSDLYVYDLRSGALDQLTSDRYSQIHAAWSPDGRTIAFATDEGPETDLDRLKFGTFRLALYDLRSGRIRLLPGHDPAGDDINPAWSPDGSSLAFLSTRTGVFNVFLWNRRTGRVHQLTNLLTGAMGTGALVTTPGLSWARDADRLAFSYFEQAGYNIYTIDHPERLESVPHGPTRVETAAQEVGTPRLVEGKEAPGLAAAEGGRPESFYRTPQGFRESGIQPADEARRTAARRGTGESPSLTAASLLDSATLALPDTAAFTFRDYSPRLTPDVVGRPQVGAEVGGYFGNGVYGGSFVELSDMLGNHDLFVAGDIQGSFDNTRLLTSYAYRKNRINYAVSFVQYPFFRYLGRDIGQVPGNTSQIGDFDVFQRDLYRSVGIGASYPFSVFSRLEFNVAASSIQTDLVYRGISLTDFSGIDRSFRGQSDAFLSPSVAYVFDNSLPGFTGPLRGRRWRLEASPSVGDLNMADFTADLRQYVPLPGPFTFATRALSFTRVSLNSDQDARRFELAWGGPYFLRGWSIGSFSFDECQASQSEASPGVFCPAIEQLIGSSALLFNGELRFPILNSVMMDWLPLNFPPIDGALFYDVGAAFTPGQDALVWHRRPGQDPVHFREPLYSYGAGLRVNVFYGIIRLDYAVAPQRGEGPGHGTLSFSFGPAF